MQSCSNTTNTQHHSLLSAIIPTASIVSINKANLSAYKKANMKLFTVTTVALSALSFVVTGLCVDQRATQLSSHLALRSSNAQTTSNISVTQGDVGQKNFTFDELFTLQKRFLDNFISPKNIIQVIFFPSDLHHACANLHPRPSLSTPPFWPKMFKAVSISRVHSMGVN